MTPRRSVTFVALSMVLGLGCKPPDKAAEDYGRCTEADSKGDSAGAWLACQAAVKADPESPSGQAAAARIVELKAKTKALADRETAAMVAKAKAATEAPASGSAEPVCKTWAVTCTPGGMQQFDSEGACQKLVSDTAGFGASCGSCGCYEFAAPVKTRDTCAEYGITCTPGGIRRFKTQAECQALSDHKDKIGLSCETCTCLAQAAPVDQSKDTCACGLIKRWEDAKHDMKADLIPSMNNFMSNCSAENWKPTDYDGIASLKAQLEKGKANLAALREAVEGSTTCNREGKARESMMAMLKNIDDVQAEWTGVLAQGDPSQAAVDKVNKRSCPLEKKLRAMLDEDYKGDTCAFGCPRFDEKGNSIKQR